MLLATVILCILNWLLEGCFLIVNILHAAAPGTCLGNGGWLCLKASKSTHLDLHLDFCSLQATDCNQQNPQRAYIASVGQGTGNVWRMKLPSWSVRKSELLKLNYGVQMIIGWLGVQGAALHKGSKDNLSFCLLLYSPFILSLAVFL